MQGHFFVLFLENNPVNLHKKCVWWPKDGLFFSFFDWKKKSSDGSTGLINYCIHVSQENQGHPTTGIFILAQCCYHTWTHHINPGLYQCFFPWHSSQLQSQAICISIGMQILKPTLRPLSHLVSRHLPRSWTVGYIDIKRKKSSSPESKTLTGFYRKIQRVRSR